MYLVLGKLFFFLSSLAKDGKNGHETWHWWDFSSFKPMHPCCNREEKSLRHVAKISGWQQTGKRHLKLFRSRSVQLICQMLAKFSRVKSERTVFTLRKRKKKLCCVHLVYKADAWN